jgi:GH24 family phage-related lysozyme (muramidase)
MTNKRVLSKAVSELDKAKAPAKSKDIIYDPMGQWKYPGENTRIPGNDITMQGVDYPVWAQPNVGPGTMMVPGQEYNFPEADYVDEYPQMRRGGSKKSKKFTRNIMATNRIFAENFLFKKPGKKQIYDPNAPLFEDGGEANDYVDVDLTEEEIQAYRDGGYIVEDISVPQLTQAQKGITISDPKEYAYRKQMYDDSLNLNKAFQMQDKLMGPGSYKTKDKYKWGTAELKEGRKKKIVKGLEDLGPMAEDYQSEADQFKNGYDTWTARKQDKQLLNYYKKLGFKPSQIMYHSSPDVVSDKIKAVGSYFDGNAVSPIYKKPVQPVYLKKEGDKKSVQKSYNKVGNYNKNTNPKGWVSPPKKDQPYEKSRSTINKIPTVDPIGKRRIGETSNATIDPTTGNVIEVITPNYENLLPLKRLETERRNQIIESKVQQRKGSDYKTAYRDQTIISYDPNIKQFISTGSRKAPLPYSEKIGTHPWELNISQEIPESGARVWQVDGKDYYNEDDARKAQAFMPQGSYNFAPGGVVDLNPETMKKYLATLKVQENNESTGLKKNKWYPYPSSEKGSDTIAYGHKLLPGEQKYYEGITTQQAEALAKKDVLEKQTSAKGRVDAKYGKGTFDKLPQDAQMLLVDYQYNVGLQKFPKFVEAVVKGDKTTMLKEYERTSDAGKLTKRNNWTKGIIDNLEYPVIEKPKKAKVASLESNNDYTEAELTPEEIEWYKSQGYIVEELN